MDLDKIGKKIDEVLAEETSESLGKWLKNKRSMGDEQYGYLVKIGDEKVFVIADNIGEAFDVLDKHTDEDYEMITHSSVKVIK